MKQSRSWWSLQKFGKLRMKNPDDLSTGSKRKTEFVCECGKTMTVAIQCVTSGNTKSCGRCNDMPPEWWESKRFGKLSLKVPKNLHVGSGRKEMFSCECGKEKSIAVCDVTSGATISCGNCNLMTSDWWSGRKFGKLIIKTPKSLHLRSDKKELFVCDCGSVKRYIVGDVTSGKSKSCGSCAKTVSSWFVKNRDLIRSLKFPISPSSFPSGGLVPLETVKKCAIPFRASCPLCGRVYRPTMNRIKSGSSLTCGCSVNMTSRPAVEIFEFVASLGLQPDLEWKLGGYRYDVAVKESKVVIEFNGSYFHRGKAQKTRDLKKKMIASAYGYRYISVEEKDWRKKKAAIKGEISDVVLSRKGISSGARTKNEVLSGIQELDALEANGDVPEPVRKYLDERRVRLVSELKRAYEDIIGASVSSHHVMCEVKKMLPNEAFGNDPHVYYGLGLAGEAGELAGALLRAFRTGGSPEEMRLAVESELADCVIYSVILAYTTGIDLVKLVNEKAKIVEARARSGYYGGPIRASVSSE